MLLARINATIQETVTGMKVVQLFTREERNLRDFERLNARAPRRLARSRSATTRRCSRWSSSRSGITIAIVLWGGTRLASAGTLYVFIDWMRRFFLPLRDLSAKYSVMQSSMASLRAHLPAPRHGARASPTRPRRRGAVARRGRPQGEVEFEDVWFAYQGEDWVLRDVSFRVAPGERVALRRRDRRRARPP